MQRTLAIIPTYNEKANICELIRALWNLPVGLDILVVDDNSPDGTAASAAELAVDPGRNGEVFVLSRPGKMGLAAAYVAGFKWALERDYEIVVQMDADMSHDPAYIPVILETLKSCDLVIGSRFHRWKISVVNWPLHRLLLSVFGQFYMRLVMYDLSLYDYTSGFKAWRRRALAAVLAEPIHSTGYCFQIETNFKAVKGGFTVLETPIVFTDRHTGKSKMSGNIVIEAFIQPVLLRLRHAASWLGPRLR